MTEPRRFTVTLTPEILREASRGFVWRFFGWTGVAATVATVVVVPVALLIGGVAWLAGLLAAVLVLFLGVFAFALWQRERLSLAKLARMGSPEVHYELTEEMLMTSSRLGSSEIPWSSLCGLWKFPHCWLLFLDRATYFTLPLEGPSADDLAFLAARIPSVDRPIR
jgi:hypothetical protein